MNTKNIIIMYHYIRDNSNFNCFTTKQFRQQIEELSKTYKFINLHDLFTNEYKEKTCIITFDDGIKDGYNVIPILKEFDVKPVYFVPTSIFEGDTILPVQKRHLLMSKIGAKRLIEEYNELALDWMKIREEDTFSSIIKEDKMVTNMKFTFDRISQSNEIVDAIFLRYFNKYIEFEKIYLNTSEIREMTKLGFEFGVHGYDHKMLGSLYPQDQIWQLEKCRENFISQFKMSPKYISYPSGSYNFITLRLLKTFGYVAGLTTIKRPNLDLKNPFELGRYDCIDKISEVSIQ